MRHEAAWKIKELLDIPEFNFHGCPAVLLLGKKLFFLSQLHKDRFVLHCRDNFFHHVFHVNFQAGGVDAGMAADIRLFQEILVNKQLNVMLLVIHQTEDAYRARGDVQVFFHISLISKGKSGYAKLRGNFLGFEFFVSGKKEKVEVGLLAIAEEQVLADDSVQDFVYIFAGFDGHESFVVDSLIRYIQGIQKIIYAYFFFKPSGGIGRTSGFKG